MWMTMSYTCGVVAVLVVLLCAGMSFDAGLSLAFSCTAKVAVKRCAAWSRRRTTGHRICPGWTTGPENYTLAKQWDTGSWACRGIAPGSYLREISGRELYLRVFALSESWVVVQFYDSAKVSFHCILVGNLDVPTSWVDMIVVFNDLNSLKE